MNSLAVLKRMQTHNQHLIITAGGVGQRCWPLSRRACPKQFHDPLGHGRSLLQATADRFANFIAPQNTWVVTQARYTEAVQSQLPFLAPQQILCEPAAKNTAACIAYACYKIAAKYPKAQVIITPADHVVQHVGPFTQAIQHALVATDQADRLAVLGVRCTSPATGYGYIAFEEQDGVFKKVTRFVEKPTLAKAKAYLAQANYAWHTGLVIGTVATLIHQYKRHLPTLWRAFERGKQLLHTSQERAFMELLYASLPQVSFEHGILEKATHLLLVLGADLGWSDVGTWQALYASMDKDLHGNAIQGNVATLATKNCMLKSTGDTLIATYGVEDLVIVQHDQVVMVGPRDQEAQVKALVKHLAENPKQDGYL